MYQCCNKQDRYHAYIVVGVFYFNALFCASCGEVMADLRWWEKPLWYFLEPFWDGLVEVPETPIRKDG